MYKVEHLYDEGRPVEGMGDCFVEGELDNWLVVSVPVTTSRRMQEEIKNTIQARMNKPVMVISHNTSFMKATRLRPSEAAKVIKKGEDYGEAHARALEDAASGIGEEALGGVGDVDSDGHRSRCGSGGGGDSGGDSEENLLSEAGCDTNEEG